MNQLVSYKQVFLARDTYPSVMNALLGYFVPQVFKGLSLLGGWKDRRGSSHWGQALEQRNVKVQFGPGCLCVCLSSV